MIGETLPAFLIYYFISQYYGLIILIFHYFYEIIATDAILEHNPYISSKYITRFFAIGQFHLQHHRNTQKNFSFIFTFWDYVFGTYQEHD